MSERHSTNRNLEKYFGLEGPFQAACDLARHRALPPEVLAHADTLGNSDLAYMLGYAFGAILKVRNMRITQDDLTQIGWMKISTGRPSEFENGFRAFQAKNPA